MIAPREIGSHTAFCGVAAVIVVFYHLGFGAPVTVPGEGLFGLAARGYLFVDFFFILSGFILVHVYGGRLAKQGKAQIRAFYAARVARIWPLHLLVLGAFAAYGLVYLLAFGEDRPTTDWAVLLPHLMLLQAWGPFEAESWNVPAWSISAEMVAYALFPWLLFATGNGQGPRRWLLWALAILLYLPFIVLGTLDIVEGLALLRCLAGFSLGTAIALTPIPRLSVRALSIAQLAALLAIAVIVAAKLPDMAAVPAFAVLTFATADDRGLVARSARGAWLRWLGERSYAIYLIHVPLIAVSSDVVWAALSALGQAYTLPVRVLFLLGFFTALLVLSALSYRFFEMPARQYLGRRLAGRAPSPAVPAP